MKLETLKVKNFRTINSDLTISMAGGLTIVGPNSSGKTNVLKAIEMFFTGFENQKQYDIKRDFPENVEGGQTSLTATFVLEDDDDDVIAAYGRLNECLEQPKTLSDRVTVYLTFTKSGNPSYRVFAGEKYSDNRKFDFNRNQTQLLLAILNSFECHYVPSAKSINGLYQELLLPFIKRSIAEKLREKVTDIEKGLEEISDVIDVQLHSVGMSNIKSHFKIPNDSLEHLLSSFEYHLSDPVKTEIERKGMGIQSAAILASFTWITQEEKRLGKTSIWLIEEPESYLHPELATSCNMILKSLNEECHLVTTTHSLSFVPQDPKNILGTSMIDGYSQFSEFDTYTKATQAIRNSLGVKFSDFCNLGLLNVYVEGKTDRELFKWALSKIEVQATGRYAWSNVRQCEFLDFGGTNALEGFVKATYEYTRKERPVVVVLDGDDAGDKTRKNLQQFLAQKAIPFECNKHFVMLPKGFTVESLFPDEWIIDAQREHPGWFKGFSLDMNNRLLPFDFSNEDAKHKIREHLKHRAEQQRDHSWIKDFETLFDTIDHALEHQNSAISSTASKKHEQKSVAA